MPYTPPTASTPTTTQQAQMAYLTGSTPAAVNAALTGSNTTVANLQQQVNLLLQMVAILMLLLADCLNQTAVAQGWSSTSEAK